MLILSRKSGESITIGPDINVRIVAVKGKAVKIAIDAPRQVEILRGELHENSKVRRDTHSHILHSEEMAPAA
jgi:carbon storage regulator